MNKTLFQKSRALQYAKLGLHVVPLHSIRNGQCSCSAGFDCQHPGKHPRTPSGVTDATTSRKRIKAWWNKWQDANIGIATGRLSRICVLDIDGNVGRTSLKALQEKHGRLPKTVRVKTGKGHHRYFRCGDVRVGNSAGRLGKGIDVRGDKGYVVAAGSTHISGKTYRFLEGRALEEIKVAAAPDWLLALVRKQSSDSSETGHADIAPIPAAKLDRARAYADSARQSELERLGKAPTHQRNDTLNVAAFKLGQLVPYGILDSAVITADLTRVAREIGLGENEIEPTITSGLKAGLQYPRRLPFMKSDQHFKPSEPPQKSNDEVTRQLAALWETDTDNAERFARRFGKKALYTPGRGWLVFDGKRWRDDKVGQVVELAKQTARLIADESRYLRDDDARAARRRFANQSLSKGSLDKMVDLAKSLLAVEDKKLDANPWLLNVENGTIDLRTGRRERHDPRDLLTKIAPVRANRHADCPIFEKFLKQITGDDESLREFIQKGTGYSLTGITSEQVFFFVYGRSGNNGKSTLVSTFRALLGDYACHTPTESLLVKQYDNNIPADLARLGGSRMVTAIEANAKRHLDEAKMKAMTGGEPITARFMRQNYFEFTPEFKIWLVANDRPRVRGTDDAFWRRVRTIPLTVEIPSNERDKDLLVKLHAEWPGILAWAVRGCLKWQRDGLAPPKAVSAAIDDWHAEMDHLKRFVSEQLIFSPGHKTASSEVYDRYGKWCAGLGEHPLKIQDFNAKLQESRDITHTRVKGRSWWRGIKFSE